MKSQYHSDYKQICYQNSSKTNNVLHLALAIEMHGGSGG